MEQPRQRGWQSTSKYGGNFRLRMSNEEYDLIHAEAAELGISGSMFARCAAVRTAHALKKHRETASTEEEAIDGSDPTGSEVV